MRSGLTKGNGTSSEPGRNGKSESAADLQKVASTVVNKPDAGKSSLVAMQERENKKRKRRKHKGRRRDRNKERTKKEKHERRKAGTDDDPGDK